ncbi:hypothetical protein BLOT_007503 [Blomia tropicalis]|nr:hypothetical protein BLOT_007503 [Blomia tropicalis]
MFYDNVSTNSSTCNRNSRKIETLKQHKRNKNKLGISLEMPIKSELYQKCIRSYQSNLSPAMDANMNEDNNNQDSNTSRMIKTGTSGGGAGSGSGAGGLDASISVMSTIRTTVLLYSALGVTD